VPPGLVSEISVSRPGSSQALWIVLHWTAIKSLVGEPTPADSAHNLPINGPPGKVVPSTDRAVAGER